jgi:transcriptional regulator with XRE-family HTH domain
MKDDKNTLTKFGNNLRKLRTERGLSQEKLALELEFDRTYISLLERGKRNPSLITLNKIAERLGVDVRELLK